MQGWTQEEFDQFLAQGHEDKQGDATMPAEPRGLPPTADEGREGKGKGKGKDKGGGGGNVRNSRSSSNHGLESKLEAQIRRQTENMLHFTKAASSCISALRIAADMSRQAATTFDRERQAMEEGCEAMIDAFGLYPRQLSRSRKQLEDDSTPYELARHVRRGAAPY